MADADVRELQRQLKEPPDLLERKISEAEDILGPEEVASLGKVLDLVDLVIQGGLTGNLEQVKQYLRNYATQQQLIISPDELLKAAKTANEYLRERNLAKATGILLETNPANELIYAGSATAVIKNLAEEAVGKSTMSGFLEQPRRFSVSI